MTNTQTTLEAIRERAKRVASFHISGLGDRDRSTIRADAQALLTHLKAGGSLGWGPFRPKAVRRSLYLVTQVRVNGHFCRDPRELQRLIEWIDVADQLYRLSRSWSLHVNPPKGPVDAQVAAYSDLLKALNQVVELQVTLSHAKASASAISRMPPISWHEPNDVEAVRAVARAAEARQRLESCRGEIDDLRRTLNPSQDSASTLAATFVQAVQERDAQRYSHAYERLREVLKYRSQREWRIDLLNRVRRSAPKLAAVIESASAEPVWDTRVRELAAAWNWARATAWLSRVSDPNETERLSAELESQTRVIRETLRDLAAEKAWGYCLSRLTEHERQYLVAWRKAIERIGKGTGKYAARHRRAARENLDQCRSAIPAWIMPIYRVAETVRPGRDIFDVAIVDEASQSGPEALFLLYLARKIVVVGDDKQISPEFVGINREDVERLRERFVLDLPHSDLLDLDTSFFGQAEVRFGSRIRLREHFRCMPEIIQFSNNLCYRSEPLIPLRQYGGDRPKPIEVRHVSDGYQKGESPWTVNPPEAEHIARQIAECCGDPAYDGLSMGVISLLGEHQAKLIEEKLKEAIGPEEMDKRKLVCGDAYAFQGDERDVVFLSLVSAPREGHRIGTLSSQKDERRFNVASSRARDQMWLFHTARVTDLSKECCRRKLLEYCLNPTVRGPAADEIGALIERAERADRSRERPPAPFESWFEIDVFLEVASRGYRVRPQYEIAGYRIDLAVEGVRGRMAVECDGDYWHGPDRYEEDAARQRMLERAGLRFWRIRGSHFYRAPAQALEGLWKRLDECGIHPSMSSGAG